MSDCSYTAAMNRARSRRAAARRAVSELSSTPSPPHPSSSSSRSSPPREREDGCVSTENSVVVIETAAAEADKDETDLTTENLISEKNSSAGVNGQASLPSSSLPGGDSNVSQSSLPSTALQSTTKSNEESDTRKSDNTSEDKSSKQVTQTVKPKLSPATSKKGSLLSREELLALRKSIAPPQSSLSEDVTKKQSSDSPNNAVRDKKDPLDTKKLDSTEKKKYVKNDKIEKETEDEQRHKNLSVSFSADTKEKDNGDDEEDSTKNRKRRLCTGGGDVDNDSDSQNTGGRKRRMSAVNAVAAATIAMTTGIVKRKRVRNNSPPPDKTKNDSEKETVKNGCSSNANCLNVEMDIDEEKDDDDDGDDAELHSSNDTASASTTFSLDEIPKLKPWEVVWPENHEQYSSDAVKVTRMALSMSANNVIRNKPPSAAIHDKQSSRASGANLERRKRPRNRNNSSTTNNNNHNQNVIDLKMELYMEGMRVHRGKGAEKRFADYWDALSRYVSATAAIDRRRRSTGSSADALCNGIEVVLNGYLKTKGMRRLHNKLILGLMKDCLQTNVSASKYYKHIPRQWKNKVERKTSSSTTTKAVEISSSVNAPCKLPSSQNKILPQSITSAPQPPPLQSHQKKDVSSRCRDELGADERDRNRWTKDYGVYSGVWTVYGNDGIIAPTLPVSDDMLPLAVVGKNDVLKEANFETSLPSACLPGAIEVDPLVRKLTKREGLNVSEWAIWFLVVAVREHAASVLRHVISNKEEVDFGKITELSSSLQLAGSGNQNGAENKDAMEPKKEEGNDIAIDATKSVDPAKEKKVRMITSLDLADVLSSRPMVGGGSVGGSTSRMVWERCFSTAGSKMISAIPPRLEAIQASINKEIEIAAAKRRRITPDSSDIVIEIPKSEKIEAEKSTPPPAKEKEEVKAKEAKEEKEETKEKEAKEEKGAKEKKEEKKKREEKKEKEEKTAAEVLHSRKTEVEKPAETKNDSSRAADDKKTNTAARPVVASKKFVRGMGRGAKNLSALKARAAAAAAQPAKTPDADTPVKNGEKTPEKSNPPESTSNPPQPTSNPQLKETCTSGRGAGGRGAGGRGAGRGGGGRGAGRGFGGRGFGVKNLAMMRARSVQGDDTGTDGEKSSDSKTINDKTPSSAQENANEQTNVDGGKNNENDIIKEKELALAKKVDKQHSTDGNINDSGGATKLDISNLVPDKNGGQEAILIPPLPVPGGQSKQS